MKNFIVKVQRDLTGTQVLVSDKLHNIFYQGPITEDLIDLMPNRPDKIYAMARMHGPQVEILHTVKRQNW